MTSVGSTDEVAGFSIPPLVFHADFVYPILVYKSSIQYCNIPASLVPVVSISIAYLAWKIRRVSSCIAMSCFAQFQRRNIVLFVNAHGHLVCGYKCLTIERSGYSCAVL